MQKHDVWISNQGYMAHLNTLTRIRQRKRALKTHRSQPSKAPQSSRIYDCPSRVTCQEGTAGGGFARSGEGMLTMREMQVVWDNYHLGKRIIETAPVISKQQLDQEYRRHKIRVQNRSSQSATRLSSAFRGQKLQEYKQNVGTIATNRAIQSATHRLFLQVSIHALIFHKQRPMLEQLDLVMRQPSKKGKINKQHSERFPAQKLLEKTFYFSVPRRLVCPQDCLSIQIRNHKGLNIVSLGTFSFPAQNELCLTSQLYHCGKMVGEVEVSTAIGKRLGPR